jgi:phosphate uptake regulator
MAGAPARSEARKVQVTGGSTYVVSLPKKWATRHRLAAGDTVFVREVAGGALEVSPQGAPRRETRLVLPVQEGGGGEKLLRELIGAYVGGAAAVELQFPPALVTAVRKTVRDFTRLVIGPEILEERRDAILIQDLSDARELSLERCLRRMHLITAAMHRDALHALLEGDTTLAADVVARDEDVDRLYWMVAKQFSLLLTDPGFRVESGGEPSAALLLRMAAKSLERIADHAARIAEHATALGHRPRKEFREPLHRAGELALGVLDAAFAALAAADLDRANQAITARGALDKVLAVLSTGTERLRGAEVLHIAAIVESLARTADYATDIAETAINHVVLRRLQP